MSEHEALDHQDVEQILTQALELAELKVSNEGNHFHIIAVDACFATMSRVKKQQLIYAPLQQYIATNQIHAVSIKTYTPDEWLQQQKFNSM